MDNKLILVERLLRFDRSAFADLRVIINGDPKDASDILWSFIIQVAELHSHVPSGFVDRAFLMLIDLIGRADTESLVLQSWDKLSDETRGEILYSGIANPEVFTNQFCVSLYRLSKNIGDRRTIACSLYSTASKRRLPLNVLVELIQDVGQYGDKERDSELNSVIRKMLNNLPLPD